MCDFEQRVNVVQVYLPELENVDLLGVQTRYVGVCITQVKQEMFVVLFLVQLVPSLVHHRLRHLICRGVTEVLVRILEQLPIVSKAERYR